MNAWLVFWLCLGGVFGVAGLMTRSLHVLAFCVAAWVAAAAAFAGALVPLQWGLYALLSIVLLFAVERIPFVRA